MHGVSTGQGENFDDNENDVRKEGPLNKTFGEEGTNKTQPRPDPDAKPSDVPGSGKHIPSSPYTRR